MFIYYSGFRAFDHGRKNFPLRVERGLVRAKCTVETAKTDTLLENTTSSETLLFVSNVSFDRFKRSFVAQQSTLPECREVIARNNCVVIGTFHAEGYPTRAII